MKVYESDLCVFEGKSLCFLMFDVNMSIKSNSDSEVFFVFFCEI